MAEKALPVARFGFITCIGLDKIGEKFDLGIGVTSNSHQSLVRMELEQPRKEQTQRMNLPQRPQLVCKGALFLAHFAVRQRKGSSPHSLGHLVTLVEELSIVGALTCVLSLPLPDEKTLLALDLALLFTGRWH